LILSNNFINFLCTIVCLCFCGKTPRQVKSDIRLAALFPYQPATVLALAMPFLAPVITADALVVM